MTLERRSRTQAMHLVFAPFSPYATISQLPRSPTYLFFCSIHIRNHQHINHFSTFPNGCGVAHGLPSYILVLLGKEGSGSRGDGGRAEHLEHALADAIGRPPAVALASTKRLGGPWQTYLGWMAHVRLLPLLIAVSLTFPRAATASDPGSIALTFLPGRRDGVHHRRPTRP